MVLHTFLDALLICINTVRISMITRWRKMSTIAINTPQNPSLRQNWEGALFFDLTLSPSVVEISEIAWHIHDGWTKVYMGLSMKSIESENDVNYSFFWWGIRNPLHIREMLIGMHLCMEWKAIPVQFHIRSEIWWFVFDFTFSIDLWLISVFHSKLCTIPCLFACVIDVFDENHDDYIDDFKFSKFVASIFPKYQNSNYSMMSEGVCCIVSQIGRFLFFVKSWKTTCSS